MKRFYTAESVTEGHPDKLCDLIADSILDECLKGDPEARVACEVFATKGTVLLAGEITSKYEPDVLAVAEDVVEKVGYQAGEILFDALIHQQSPDIAQGVQNSMESRKQHVAGEEWKMGAGDQGVMTGYACSETKQFLPLPVVLAHRIVRELSACRISEYIRGLLPDFARVGTDITTHLAKLSSIGEELDAGERLKIFRDFFKEDVSATAEFDFKEAVKRGHDFKDWFAPDSMEFLQDHFKIDGRYGRVLYMQDYATYVRDSMVSELCDLSRNLMLSIDILPVPTDEAVREIQNKLLGVETNVTNWQRRQNENNNFSATIPYEMELQRTETKEMLNDLTTRDQRMMFGVLTIVHMADSYKELNSDTETLKSIARKNLCQLSTLRWQQMDGLHTALPFGPRKINALRTLTTESTAVLIPFHTQEIMQEGGIYYGQNAVSKNMIVVDRKKLLNGNSFRLGVSGSGKSFSAKEEIVALALATEDDILILDPESEFGNLTVALGGEVVKVSATSGMHLNAMDMDSSYGDDTNPLIEKSEFLLSVFEQLIGAGNLGAKDKSIIDRCTADTYRDYIRSGYTKEVPTLKDLYRQLMLQEEPEARALALSAELFTSGSLNTFAHKTNVDTKNRIMDYDIRELGSQLMPLGMLVTLDAIFNRVIQNWKKGKRTWIFCDEFYLLFRYPYSAEFFYKLWKRIRKYNGFVNAMSQNVDEVLRSDTARLMLANSEFLVMLNQASTDREELARLLNISDNQLGYITNVKAGSGLIRCSGNLVPFENTFPRNTKLYQLMTTKPGESLKAV